MPNIKSAKKKVRKDNKRAIANYGYLSGIKKAFKNLTKLKGKKASEGVKKAYSLIDKAMKKKIIHKNKAARLKSRVTKLGA